MPLPYTLPSGLRTGCRILQWIALAILVVFIAGLAWYGAPGDYIATQLDEIGSPARDSVVFTPAKTWITNGLAWVPALSASLALLGAALVFRAFASGQVFEPPAVRAVSTFGWLIVAHALIQIVMPSLMVLALTYDNPPGQRTLTFSVSSTHLTTLLIGLVLLVIGQVYTRAVAIADDNRQIV
jgi:hypothetical protein